MTASFYRWQYRSSVTGLWVTRRYAKLHPKTTQRQRIKVRRLVVEPDQDYVRRPC
jgi:positive regulator of sigma E activity